MRKLLVKSINLNDSHHTTRRIDQSTNSKIKASLYHKSSRESLSLSRIFHLISMVTQRHARFHPKKATRLQ